MKLAELNQQLQNKFSKKYPKYLRDYLEVRKSKIKGAGLGLFTTIDIEKGEYIDVYMGRKLNASQVLKEDPKYLPALIKSAELCAVKKHFEQPPQFEIYTTTTEMVAA